MTAVAHQHVRLARALQWGGLRLAVVVIGGMLVLQSSGDIDLAKESYGIIAVIAVGSSVRRVVAGRRGIPGPYRQLLALDILLVGVLSFSFIVARLHGTTSIDWFRDTASYGLFAAVPILAWDAGVSSSRKSLIALLVLVGVLASLSWTIEWVDRRNIAELPLDRLLLPAGRVAGALYAFAIAVAITAARFSFRWVLLAGAILGLFLATGSRSAVLLMAIPLAIILAARARPLSGKALAVVAHLLTAAAVFVTFQMAVSLFPIAPGTSVPGASVEPTSAAGRIGSIGSLMNNPMLDPSVRERIAQYRAAWQLTVTSPLVGVGPGHPIEWVDVSGVRRDAFTADTPFVLLAKFGIIGSVVVVLLVSVYALNGAALVKRYGWTPETLALFGFAVSVSLGLPLGMPLEDKAFSFALALLLAIAIANHRRHHTEQAVTESSA